MRRPRKFQWPQKNAQNAKKQKADRPSFSSSSSSSKPRGGIEDEDENEEEDEGAVHGQGVWPHKKICAFMKVCSGNSRYVRVRSEEHTSELQSRSDLVCRLLLEKKKRQSPTRPVRDDILLRRAR